MFSIFAQNTEKERVSRAAIECIEKKGVFIVFVFMSEKKGDLIPFNKILFFLLFQIMFHPMGNKLSDKCR